MKNNQKQRGRPFDLSEREAKILYYLWRWKIASTASVHESINKTLSPYSTYKSLDKLEKRKIITSQHDELHGFTVWFLTSRGFSIIRNTLNIAEEGFLSENHNHDRLVQAFHLGEWSTYQLPTVDFWTEQELRRYDINDYPDWIPSSSEHRPDGYTRVKGLDKTWIFAYEVELSTKRSALYEKSLSFYKHARLIHRVFWLIDSEGTKESILRAKNCIHDTSENYHVFVDLTDFLKNGWDAMITNGRSERLLTLRENMQRISGDIISDLLGNTKGHSSVSVHLNPIKTLGKPRPYKNQNTGTTL